MISLRRLRLVNWHNFSDDLLDLRQITYFIGVNAVGKTTIMDAIRYCLTTSKTFNALGNKKSGRTLQGSVHGKQRGEEVYTRPGHTVSYIGTELADERTGNVFVIVVRVESESPDKEMRHVQQTWYITPPGCTLEMLPFVDAGTRQPAKREQFRLENGRMSPIDKQGAAWDRICKVLGIGRADSPLGKKFKAVFQMGTSLDEIPDFRTFIYNYVLPQPEIDLAALQQDQTELERLQDVLNEARQRAQALREITQAGLTAKARENDVSINEGFILYAGNREAAGVEEEILAQLEQYNREIERLQEQYATLEVKEEMAHRQYIEVCRAAESSDESRVLEELRRQLSERKKEYAEAQKALKRLLSGQEQIETLLRKAAPYGLQIGGELRFDSIEAMPEQSQRPLLDQQRKEILALDPAIEALHLSALLEQKRQQERADELKKRIRALDEGRWLYPDNDRANTVKKAVNEELSARGMEPDAKVLCELLYMNAPDWQDCAEACLGNRRFDILVPASHYPAAKCAYERLGDETGRISLLDSPALKRDGGKLGAAADGTLAATLSSENELAKRYVTSLLGSIVCCENSSTLEGVPHSATRDLLRHYPYRLERMRKPRRFIGLDARRQQLDEAKKELDQLGKRLTELERRRRSLEDLRGEYQTAVRGTAFRDTLECWGSRARQQACWQMYERLEKQVREFEENPLLRAMKQREALFEAEWKRIKVERERVGGDIRLREDRAKTAQSRQEQAIRNAESAEKDWESYRDGHLLLVDEVEKKYADAAQRRTPGEIARNQRGRHNQFISARDAFLNQTLIPMQHQFNERYICDFPLGLEGIESFQRQYDSLVNIDLERFSFSLQKARERCKERFRKDILYHMKDDIANAKRQFKELNRIMAQLNYGEEVYRFELDGSAAPQYNAFYTLIVDKNNRHMTMEPSLDNPSLPRDAAYEAQVEELMARIMADIEEQSRARQAGKQTAATELSRYVDYRTYLDYDIRVTNSVTGQSAALTKVSRDSSGGENQAPFYIAICASLLQIYQKSEDSIRLVLLDEAFSKMTSDRIRPMMRMFRQMNLQVLLITTVEKSSAIHAYCDATYSIVKSGNRNAVAPFFLEES